MKFEYDGNTNEEKCVAYIDEHGHLIVKNTRENESSFVFMPNRNETTYWDKFDPSEEYVKFYKGDKITITF